ncbi:MAG: hypothetical protein IJ763_09875 [Lachnospiraceae bacterium]|nr:hypothetical protein [Lachnospiraceae bacterium]
MDHYFSDRVAEARAEGRAEAWIEATVNAYLDCGLSVSEIAGKLNISEEEVSKIIEKLETENLQKQN